MRACVRACVRVCVCARVYVCVFVCVYLCSYDGTMGPHHSYLRSKGVTDFTQYQCVPGHEPPTMDKIKDMVMGAGDKSTATAKKN